MKTDGTVECWGYNDSGRATPPAGVTFTQVSAGNLHTCGMRTDGTADCWGNDGDGQLTPPFGVTFTQLSAGNFHTCGVTTGGAMECSGNNGSGQTSHPAGTFIQASARGYFHSCGVTAGGTVACWGRDLEKQGDTILRMNGTLQGVYYAFADAFAASGSGDTIELLGDLIYCQDANFSKGVAITLRGGYDPAWSSPAWFSVIAGKFTIASGSVTFDGIVIQ